MTGSFVQRQLRASLTLPQGNFPGTNSNTLVLTNLRMSARVEQVGGGYNTLDLRIYGMRQADMQAVTVVWVTNDGVQWDPSAQALITLEASTGNGGWVGVFNGQFIEGGPDYRALPEVCLTAQARVGYSQQLTTPSPLSYSVSVDVATLAGQLAKQMGFAFENNGVQAKLDKPYLSGGQMDQFRELAEAAGFDYYFTPGGGPNNSLGTIVICPPNQGRQGKTPVPVNPQSGMVGYPTLQRYGVDVTVLFNPGIEMGSPIQISGSSLPGTDGAWFPFAAVHELESIKPGGHWFSHLQCMNFQVSD